MKEDDAAGPSPHPKPAEAIQSMRRRGRPRAAPQQPQGKTRPNECSDDSRHEMVRAEDDPLADARGEKRYDPGGDNAQPQQPHPQKWPRFMEDKSAPMALHAPMAMALPSTDQPMAQQSVAFSSWQTMPGQGDLTAAQLSIAQSSATSLHAGDEEKMAMDALDSESRLEHMQVIRDKLGCKVDVTEVYSPPRIRSMAKDMGLRPGLSLDFTSVRADGKRWVFSLAKSLPVPSPSQLMRV